MHAYVVHPPSLDALATERSNPGNLQFSLWSGTLPFISGGCTVCLLVPGGDQDRLVLVFDVFWYQAML